MSSADRRAVQPLRVLMTADPVGGIWTFAIDLTRALASYDVDVSLAVMGPPPSAEQRLEAASLRNLTLFERACRLEWMEEPWSDVDTAGEWLLDLEATVGPDVVHLNGYVHGALPWRAPVVMTGHSCVLSWWAAVHGEPAPPVWSRYAAAVARGLNAASVVTAPSTEMLGALQQHYGALRKATVVPNGRQLDWIPSTPKEPIVLTAGRLWDRAKNVELVCAAARSLPWPVYVAGDTRGFDDQAQPCVGVRYLGRLPNSTLLSWMSRASIYALPARYEPFGLSLLEAALCGCALVAGDRPSLREVWGDAAAYVDPDDAQMLERQIRMLIEGRQLRGLMAERARARAGELTARRMAAAYYETYLEQAGAIRPLLSLRAV